MPYVKTDEQRGYIGAWLRRERTRPDRDWSPEQVVEMLALRGQRVRPDYYRQLESGSGGKKPGPTLLAALIDVYGSEPEPFAVTEEPDDLAAAIRAQTEAMRELVAELREEREQREGRQEALAIVLGELSGTLEGMRLVPNGKPRSNNG